MSSSFVFTAPYCHCRPCSFVAHWHQLKISFYRLSDFELAYELPCPRTEYIDFSADGRLMLTAHEDSGLLSLYMLLSDTQGKHDLYQRLSQQQLNNRDLRKN